ncbi:TPA: hypothetical protein QDC20_003939 [Burkholderia aenigmatica]|uniref:hypothetical protein n=1 Tax=Burkholderia sp. AU45251 TaxID=3059204 RepID=UPI0026501E38|nr:hypothetical protein [Burkholderia sp. AU45251]HDR9486095.1 hypothetical protein [Burkholderia aenigmatica]MDN7517118.1 hypothetical protein [Burkholderia sp. AU45251]HDR9517811.1 hypothetical protein [Burkholderia aenigmatica]HDR9594515.1 hypothetical protein [Burkholderia aenigmatica]HDR9600546.1 hypothetical protein [Burkholderia aenigmatica]
MKTHTLKYGAPLLCALALLPAAASAAGTCPAADTAARAAIDAQHRVQQIRVPPSDGGGVDIAPPLRDALRAYKQALVGAIDARLACSDEQVDPAALKRTLATTLGVPAQPTTQFKDGESAFGRNPDVGVERGGTSRPLLFVRAGFDIACGDDNVLTAYAWENGAWRRVLRWQAGDYKDIGGAYGAGFWFSALPGGQVAVVHGTPWCASRWSQFAVDVVAPANGSAVQRTVFHSENSYVLDENPIRFKVHPDGFEVRATVGSKDSDVMTRPGVFRYRVDGATVQRVQPVALNGRDFVDEWLKADDALAREWSEPAAAAAALKGRQVFEKASKTADRGFAYGPVRSCSDSKDRFQVELDLTGNTGETVARHYALIRQERNGFTLLGLSTAAEPACRGANLMPQH